MKMRLANFIRTEIEPILQDWEEFANTLFHARYMDKTELRDHAKNMILAIADDLDSSQSESEQSDKSKGLGPDIAGKSWAEVHGDDRQTSGFSVMETVSEFRALRASVVSQWTKAYPTLTGFKLEDLTRFHEAIDQAVAESLEYYANAKEMDTRLFGAILLASPDPIYVLDLEGRFVYANKATTELFGLQEESIIGKSTFDLGFSFASDFQRNLQKVITEQTTYRGKFVYSFDSGRGDRFEYLLAPVLDEHRNTEATVCISRDITEQSLAEEKIWYNAHYDLLTGLPNRRLFMDRLEQQIKHAKRSNLPLAVLFMDLDGFKEVNDTFGHEAGDSLLSEVAKRLTECVREEDTIARLGGDEFTVLLTDAAERKEVEHAAKRIIDALTIPFHIQQESVRIAVSIGIAFYPQDALSPPTVLRSADQAMYKAKNSGSGLEFF